MTEQRIIAGALFDFLGYLTGRDGRLILGAREPSENVLPLLNEWAALRGLNLEGADVQGWQDVEARGAVMAEHWPGELSIKPDPEGRPITQVWSGAVMIATLSGDEKDAARFVACHNAMLGCPDLPAGSVKRLIEGMTRALAELRALAGGPDQMGSDDINRLINAMEHLEAALAAAGLAAETAEQEGAG